MLSQILSQRILSLIFILISTISFSQSFHSVQDGDWNSPATWDTGTVPNASNSTAIFVDHNIVIPTGYVLAVNGLEVNSILTVSETAIVTIDAAQGLDGINITTGNLLVYGEVACQSGTQLAGTTLINTTFYNGSIYRHLTVDEGTVPLATWETDATFSIEEFTGNLTMQSPNWSQSFGNLVYDCHNQGEFVEFKGALKKIKGNFIISNTNLNKLRLSINHPMTLEIDGNIEVNGPSQIWFTREGNVDVHIGGNFLYNSTSGASSYTTTTGNAIVTVNGDFTIDANWRLRLSSGSSTGFTNLILKGNVDFLNGTLDALGTGTITFSGVDQVVNINSLAKIEGNISYHIESSAQVDLGQSVLANTLSGDLVVDGTLALGSSSIAGALNDQVNIMGSVIFSNTGRLLLNGIAPQYIAGNTPLHHLDIDNAQGVTIKNDVVIGGDLSITNGQLDADDFNISVTGNISHGVAGSILNVNDLFLNGTENQTIALNGLEVNTLYVNNNDHIVFIIEPLNIRQSVTFQSVNTMLGSNGFLTLLSNESNTASIGSIDQGNVVEGDVTVQRYVAAIGDKYRYISSPTESTVADLQDDVAVTGSFKNPSSGAGIVSGAASLYYYQESLSQGSRGWKKYPTAGNASDNELTRGVGYSMYMWDGENNVTMDFTGPVNQGNIDIPITYTPGIDEFDGWNLIGNPYPSAIQWIAGSFTSQNLSASIALRDNASGIFRYWDGQIGDIPNGVIALGQSFWVRTMASNPVLQLHESAKYSGDATFFRKNRDVDYVVLTLSQSGVSDNVYFRLREDALAGSDPFDIEKWQNDSFTLSLIEQDRKLAINAVEKVPCHLEIPIHVAVKDQVKGGAWTFSAEGYGKFQGAHVRLYDTVLGTESDLTPPYIFKLPANTNWATGRFLLIIDSAIPNDVAYSAPAFVCANDSLSVTIKGKQGGVQYYLEDSFHSFIYPDRTTDSTFVIRGTDFPEGQGDYRIWSGNFCQSQPASDYFQVKKIKTPTPEIHATPACQEGSALLEVIAAKDNSMYRWYENRDGRKIAHEGSRFITPSLKKTKTYVLVEEDKFGCLSEPLNAMASLVKFDSVLITYDEGILFSNFEEGNEWAFNGEELMGATSFVVADEPGVYTLTVTIEGCITTARYDHLVTEVNNDEPERFSWSPNPAQEVLRVAFSSSISFQIIDVLGINGVSVSYLCPWKNIHENEIEIRTEKLSAGLYVVSFVTNSGKKYFRFVKL